VMQSIDRAGGRLTIDWSGWRSQPLRVLDLSGATAQLGHYAYTQKTMRPILIRLRPTNISHEADS
jgi:hypothetical protein